MGVAAGGEAGLIDICGDGVRLAGLAAKESAASGNEKW